MKVRTVNVQQLYTFIARTSPFSTRWGWNKQTTTIVRHVSYQSISIASLSMRKSTFPRLYSVNSVRDSGSICDTALIEENHDIRVEVFMPRVTPILPGRVYAVSAIVP